MIAMRCMIADAYGVDIGLAMSALSEERAKLASSFLFERDRRLSAVAGLFMGWISMTYDAVVRVDPNGKPRAVGDKVHFNVSHSGRYVACAVADVPVGIDIEAEGENLDLLAAVAMPEEREVFSCMPEGEREALFCRMWTAKESYMKAVGLGMSIPPESFRVVRDGGISDVWLPRPYRIRELAAPVGYRASVCAAGDPGDPAFELMDTDAMATLISGNRNRRCEENRCRILSDSCSCVTARANGTNSTSLPDGPTWTSPGREGRRPGPPGGS